MTFRVVILVALVLVGLWFTVWKVPATADDVNFRRSLVSLALSIVGLGVSEALQLLNSGRHFAGQEELATSAGGEGFGWLCLIASILFYFKIERKD